MYHDTMHMSAGKCQENDDTEFISSIPIIWYIVLIINLQIFLQLIDPLYYTQHVTLRTNIPIIDCNNHVNILWMTSLPDAAKHPLMMSFHH